MVDASTTIVIFGGTGDLATRTGERSEFAHNIFYVRGDVGVPEDFVRLRSRLEELEASGGPGNRLFYLSVGRGSLERP